MKSWIPSAIIYQINLRSLAAREPRNAFEAAREKATAESPLAYVARNLTAIKKLGANVLYFMPPYPIGHVCRKGIGSPYSIRDFRAIEPEYGTIDEMTALVRRAHAMGLKVIFDITPNHTSRDNVWVASNPEFYVKRENGEAFYDCDWNDTAKLDYRQLALRAEMIAIYDHWLGFLGNGDGVDGFRLDMAHFINDKGFWNEAMPELKRRHADRELLFLAECYGIDNNMDLFARGINAAYDDDFYKVCQDLYGIDESGATRIIPAADLAQNDAFKDRYLALQADGIAGAFEKALMNYESRFGRAKDAPFLARYTDNHDEGRGMYLYGEGAVRAVNQLIFLSNHTLPFILTGEEFGAVNRPPIHDRMNPIGKKRRVQSGDRVWEQDCVEFEGNLFARGFARRRGLYAFFQELIRLRLKNRELTLGAFALVDAGEDVRRNRRAVVAFDRTLGNRVLHCAVNMGTEPRALRNDAFFSGNPVYGKLADGALPPFSAVVTRAPSAT
ncbi:MAG: alpha-amylase family glycosyl hydrolase [bacterium]